MIAGVAAHQGRSGFIWARADELAAAGRPGLPARATGPRRQSSRSSITIGMCRTRIPVAL